MECDGDYHLEALDKDVRVTKQVRALSSDLLKTEVPRDVYSSE